jgi:hypothetical protein
MLNRIGMHLRGNVVAYLALFLALGGSAVAAKKISTKQLANNAVKTGKIANNAVTSPKIGKGAVTGDKIAAGAVSAGKLDADVKAAKAYGVINITATDISPTYSIDQSRSSGIASVSEPTAGATSGVACVDFTEGVKAVVVSGVDSAGAVSPFAFASVNYGPQSGGITCPANADVRVTTFDKLNAGPVDARFSLVAF